MNEDASVEAHERRVQVEAFADFLASKHTQLWEGPYLIHEREGQEKAAAWFMGMMSEFRAWERKRALTG